MVRNVSFKRYERSTRGCTTMDRVEKEEIFGKYEGWIIYV
jgi:hypothetical protein